MFQGYENLFVSARKASSDIGRKSEQGRYKDIEEIIKANFKRVQESLRVIEEYSRVYDFCNVQKAKKMRFKVYSLEKDYYEKN